MLLSAALVSNRIVAMVLQVGTYREPNAPISLEVWRGIREHNAPGQKKCWCVKLAALQAPAPIDLRSIPLLWQNRKVPLQVYVHYGEQVRYAYLLDLEFGDAGRSVGVTDRYDRVPITLRDCFER